MKNYLRIIHVVIIYAVLLSSCKKSNDAKNYAASISDKTWWGVFTYAAMDPELYSVHFNADHTLLWSQFSDDYSGQWVVNGKDLSITFDVSKTVIKASISDNDKLLNSIDNTGSIEINSGQIISNPNISLDNTVWKGKIITGAPYIVEMSFRPPFKLDLQTMGKYSNNTYKRTASGGAFRADINTGGAGASTRFFGVIVSDSEMKGGYNNAGNQWQASKQ